MSRTAHWLKGNKRTTIPRYLVFVDTETKQKTLSNGDIEQRLWMGWACYYRRAAGSSTEKEEWFYFRKQAEFWHWLLPKIKSGTKVYLISHNINFDFSVLHGFSFLRRNSWKLTQFYMNQGTKIFTFEKAMKQKKAKLVVVDNVNFFQGKLKTIGKVVGLDKLEVDFEKDSEDYIKVYCKRDVEILVALWKQYLAFLKSHDLGNFGKTSAAQSFNAFRHRFMKKKILLHDNQEVLEMERKAYHGGRTEAFYIGKVPAKKIYYLDVNSMYPYVMKAYKYPRVLLETRENISLSELKRLFSEYSLIAEVDVTTNEPVFAYYNGSFTLFPVGHLHTVLTTNELIYAAYFQQIDRIYKVAVYEQGDIFSDYIEYFYKLKRKYKEERNKLYYYFIKRFMNSLYGKFAQMTDEWKTVGYDYTRKTGIYEKVDMDTGEIYTERVIAGLVQRKVNREVSYNAFPAIAAHVTANARLYLWALIKKAGRENVYYCDTDSLFVNEEGFTNLKEYIDNYELGKLKIEDTSDCLKIYSAKDYEFGHKVVRKGIREDAEQIKENVFRQLEFPTLLSMIREGKINGYTIKQKVKKLYRNYNKGIVTSSGWIQPFTI